MGKADIIENAEIELDRLVLVFRHSGMNYWDILKVFMKRCSTLAMQSEAEYESKIGT